MVGSQQSPAVPLANERSGKVTLPSARMGHLCKSGWDGAFLTSVSWGWGLSRQVVNKNVPEFNRGMVSGIKCLRPKRPRHGIRIASLTTVMMEAWRWMNRA